MRVAPSLRSRVKGGREGKWWRTRPLRPPIVLIEHAERELVDVVERVHRVQARDAHKLIERDLARAVLHGWRERELVEKEDG